LNKGTLEAIPKTLHYKI